MTLEEFIAEFRAERGDAATPYLWSDENIVRYLNSAMDEACERALLIEDSTTEEVCTITVEAGTALYPLDARVIKVKRAALDGRKIDVSSVEAEDERDAFWETRAGTPRRFICQGSAAIRLTPTPTAAGSLNLTVYRRQLAPFSADNTDAVAEIPEIYHPRLMPWVYRCALLRKDSEVFDEDEALKQEAVFTAAFGQRPDANVQRKRRDRRPPIVRSAW